MKRKYVEKVWREHEKQVYKLAWRFADSSGFSFEDLRSAAYLGFVKAFKAWDPARGKFTTLVHHAVSNSIKTYMHKELVNRQRYPELITKEENPKSSLQTPRAKSLSPVEGIAFNELMSRLTPDAKTIVGMVLNAPRRTFGMAAAQNFDSPFYLKKARKALKARLSAMDWGPERIESAWNNITTNLQENM